MTLDERIQEWVKQGVVTAEQAAKMLATVPSATEEGTVVRRTDQTAYLLFAGLANGVVLMIFSWLYGVELQLHVVALLWMLCLAPLMYTLRSPPVIAVECLLFFAWVPLFALRGLDSGHLFRLRGLPTLMMLAGTALFAFGGLHYLLASLSKIARGLRIGSLLVVSLSLFLLGFFSIGWLEPVALEWRSPEFLRGYTGAAWGLGIAGAAFSLAVIMLQQRTARLTFTEGPICLALCAVGVASIALPVPSALSAIFYNALMLAMLITLLVVGLRRRDRHAVDIAGVGLAVLVLARFVDLFWGVLDLGPLLGIGLLLAAGCWVALRFLRIRSADAARVATTAPPP